VEAPAAAGEGLAVHFLVQQARAGGHPLHVAPADAPAVAGGVLVVDFALQHHGHGLEAAVRMPADPARLVGWREIGRAGVVEEEEGRELRMALVIEHRAYREAVADPVPFGRAVDAGVATAVRDFPGTAAGVTMVVPKGMANTINGHTDKDGVRASTVCFADITGGSVMGSTVKLTGKLTHAENGMIFKLGDPVSLEGSKDSNEFTYTIRGGGKDNVLKGFKGQILIV